MRVDIAECNLLILYLFTQPVVLDVEMFGSLGEARVACDLDAGL